MTLNASEIESRWSNISIPSKDLLAHPERYYEGFDIVWMMTSSSLVFIMIPALSLIYAGVGNRSFALTLFRLPLITAAFVGFQWSMWGYALTFTKSNLSSGWWGGESRAFALKDALARPIAAGDGADDHAIPELVYVLYEGMFASFTAALVCGGTMHKVRPARFLMFISIWSILVYDPVARWSWYSNGWANNLGVLDFAGGTPVHIVAGSTVAAFVVFCAIENQGSLRELREEAGLFIKKLFVRIQRPFREIWRTFGSVINLCAACFGQRLGTHQDSESVEVEAAEDSVVFEPYNVNYLVLGTSLLWFGWAGFNGGSALGGNLRAVSAVTATHLAACAGGGTGALLIWLQKILWRLSDDTSHANKFDSLTVFYFCDGAIAGLVAITPGAGYVPVYSAVVFGAVSAFIVHFLKKETSILLVGDHLQIFAVHTGAGLVGMCLTGLFASDITIALDGHSKMPHPEYPKGWRIGYQLADSFAGISYAFTVSLAILYFMKCALYISRSLFSTKDTEWWFVTGFDEGYHLEDRLVATDQQRWSAPRT